MMPSRSLLHASTAIALLLTTQQALAAGYALREQSSTAQASAFAGATAAAKDVSYMFFNPAALALQDGSQAHVSLSYILPESKFKDGAATTSATLGGVAIAGGDNAGDISQDALLPALYLSAEITDGLTLGLGVTAPFGLTTENDDGWIGRYHALDSELTSININPAIAFDGGDHFAFGAGVQVQYIDTKLTSAVDIGSIGAAAGVPGAAPTAQDGEVELEADDWGIGFNLGALFMPSDNTRFGLAFRSEIDHRAEGSADFDNGASGAVGDILNANGLLIDSGISAEVTTPATISAGAYHEYDNGLALMAEVAWTDWSVFDELRVEFDNPAQGDNVTTEAWDDSFFVALGASYALTPALSLHGGIAYDESPIPDDTRTPRLPGSDRYWTAIGASFDLASNISLNASYTHIFMEDADLELEAGTDPAGENFFRGDLSGRYENQIDIITIGGTIRF
ncbi:MAG: outer membrane protein transport protein [Alphaproteobacteria bacterium]